MALVIENMDLEYIINKAIFDADLAFLNLELGSICNHDDTLTNKE